MTIKTLAMKAQRDLFRAGDYAAARLILRGLIKGGIKLYLDDASFRAELALIRVGVPVQSSPDGRITTVTLATCQPRDAQCIPPTHIYYHPIHSPIMAEGVF